MRELALLNIPTKGEQHEVKKKLQEALDQEFESVFIIGYKDGLMCTSYSGYKSIEEKLGLLELLKHNLIEGAS